MGGSFGAKFSDSDPDDGYDRVLIGWTKKCGKNGLENSIGWLSLYKLNITNRTENDEPNPK